MPARFVVRPDGTIETNSPQDAVALQLEFARRRSAPNSAAPRPSDAREFLRRINGSQGKILRALLDNPEGLTDEELCARVGAKDKLTLAGMMSHIRPQAVKFGLGGCEVYESLPGEASGSRRYRLTEQFRQACAGRGRAPKPHATKAAH
jgi:hypothetical protein